MPPLRTLAFVSGGVGLALFVGGVFLAVASQPPDSCGANIHCQNAAYDKLEWQVVALWGIGLLLVGAAAAILLKERLEARQAAKRRPPAAPRPPVGLARLPPAGPAKMPTARTGPLAPRKPGTGPR